MASGHASDADGMRDRLLAAEQSALVPRLHPGVLLREEFLPEYPNLTSINLAEILNISPEVMDQFLHAKIPLNESLAKRLAIHFETSAALWLNLQREYDAWLRAATLKPYCTKYIWWKSPEEALKLPQRVIAQVMDIGTFDDVQSLAEILGDVALREVLQQAEAGQFSERAWHYWHYRLGLADAASPPPDLPQRDFGMQQAASEPRSRKLPPSTGPQALPPASSKGSWAAKLQGVLRRSEAQDYREIAALLTAGYNLVPGLAAARVEYGPNFAVMECLRALACFKGGDLDELELPARQAILNAVLAVSSI